MLLGKQGQALQERVESLSVPGIKETEETYAGVGALVSFRVSPRGQFE